MKHMPLSQEQLLRRSNTPVRPGCNAANLAIADFALPPGGAFSIERDAADRFRLKCPVGPEGMPPRRRLDNVKAVALDREMAKRHMEVRELEGMVPDGSAISFKPARAKPSRVQAVLDGKDRDKGGTIFGTDDRYLFNDRAFPWRTTGLVRTAGGRCSGTTIGPRLVLTASHCVNWSEDGESAGWITFTPGYFDGDEPWGEIAATNVAYWIQAPGSLTDAETARDYVVLVMEEDIGNVVGYPGYRTYDDAWNGSSFWQYIGYPGELAGGMRPAFQGDAVVSSSQSQGDGLVLGHFNEFTPGQSGGAAWGWWDGEPWPRVVGVGSTIGSTAVQAPHGSTNGDNEYGGGPALSTLISWAREQFPALTS